ncbi:hypothetical protein C0992_007942 [Termitomyces sp. T32_za158]|nr:hypothetical protein C0992_007942 [Termitomyces sp. T32_za158]
MNILVIGGSRNIGYHAAQRFLEAGHHVTFLLRNLSIFDNNDVIQKFVESKKAHLVRGDALIRADVERAWNAAAANVETGVVDVLLFTVGARTSQGKFHITKGLLISPPNLVTSALLNSLSTLPSPHPKIIIVSSTGISRRSKAVLPYPLRILYSYMGAAVHRDKCGVERLAAHVTGWNWDAGDFGEPREDILDSAGKWKMTPGLPTPGSLENVLVVRPALLTDGECMAEKAKGQPNSRAPYRVSEEDFSAWTVSRKDVAHFIFDTVVNRWDEFGGKRINIGY